VVSLRYLVGSAAGLVVFAVMFSVSAFVIGPAINGGGEAPGAANRHPRSTTAAATVERGSHE
jgi:hypothetical protein